jgi:LuxR family transcriptional regulator, maltose regulon positive regulatory protein
MADTTTSLPLLATKLHIPRRAEGLVERSELLDQLDGIRTRRLTLISAPAGFGKTTLLADWAARTGFPTAWLSLDANDNEPQRFLSYIIAAIQSIVPGFGEKLQTAIQRGVVPPPETMLALLVNELAAVEQNILLVLDDYHVVNNDIVNDGLLFVLDHAPAQIHVAIGTRMDLPIPISRFRVRGQLLEIRASDLRFTSDEAGRFLNGAMKLQLSDEQLAALFRRTEGWVAGLQMAGISLQGRTDTDRFIEAFTGADRYVLDYLLEEVLNSQSPDLHEAIVKLAVLDRFNASLCEAVTGHWNGQEMLEWLEQANLFLVPLDNRREWYRFHHLFADLLRHRLHQLHPEQEAELHTRASIWLEENGLVLESMKHIVSARSVERATELLRRHWKDVTTNGDRELLEQLFGIIPESEILAHPDLGLVRAWSFVIPRRYDEMDALLDTVETHIGDADDPLGRHMRGEMLLLRGISALRRERAAESIPLFERAIELLPEENPTESEIWYASQVLARSFLGMAYSHIGELDRAEEVNHALLRHARATSNELDDIAALGNLAEIAVIRGQLTLAERFIREALQYRDRPSFAASGLAVSTYRTLCEIHLSRNELDSALDAGLRAVDFAEPYAPQDVLNAYRMLTLVYEAQGNREANLDAIERLERLAIPDPIARMRRMVAATRARRDLRDGDLAAAMRWVETYGAGEPTADGEEKRGAKRLTSAHRMLYARVLLHSRKYKEMLATLDSINAAPPLRYEYGVEKRALRAIAIDALGQTDDAYAELAEAIRMAAPERFIRVFANESERVGALLSRMPLKRFPGLSGPFIEELCAACGVTPGTPLPTVNAQGSRDLDGLTSRELEILQLLARGYTNQKIADKLYVSINTIKTHVSNLFDKLGARNRIDALVRAKDAGILVEE